MENNEETKLQKENKIDKQNNNKILIMFLIIIFILLGYIIFSDLTERFNENTDKNSTTQNDNAQSNDKNVATVNDDIKIIINMDDNINKEPLVTYIKEKIEIIKYDYTTDYDFKTNEINVVETEEGLYAKYVIFKGGDESISKLNDKMIKKVNEVVENYKTYGKKITSEEIKDGVYIKVQDDGTMMNYSSYSTIEYNIIEYKKYYLLLEIDCGGEYRGSGFGNLTNYYPIDKYTGKIVSNDEIINSIEYIDELKKRLINDAGEQFDDEYISYFEPKHKKEYISELTNKLNNNDFVAYFSDYGNLNFNFKNLPEYGEITYEYNTETNEWDDVF